ncbi:MAG: S-adenosylmethionine decarboxylase [Candidatus Micrarchaeota archaeon]|nr:S-adenosylmethionine decarboxylase [Candidatus Micrarchaeota archaeon]
MKDLAPRVFRQRLLIDCIYHVRLDEKSIKKFLGGLAKELGQKTYDKASVHTTPGSKKINSGYDAFIPLTTSGIYMGVWPKAKFVSIVVYTCKKFEPNKAIKFARKTLRASRLEYREF